MSTGWIDVVERRDEAPRMVSLALRSPMVFTPLVCQLTSTRPKSLIRPRKRNSAGLNLAARGSTNGVTKKFGIATAITVPSFGAALAR